MILEAQIAPKIVKIDKNWKHKLQSNMPKHKTHNNNNWLNKQKVPKTWKQG